MIELIIFGITAIIAIIAGKTFVDSFGGCSHSWKLIEQGQITNKNRYGEKIIKGFIKVYECEHCKRMRKEQVELDD